MAEQHTQDQSTANTTTTTATTAGKKSAVPVKLPDQEKVVQFGAILQGEELAMYRFSAQKSDQLLGLAAGKLSPSEKQQLVGEYVKVMALDNKGPYQILHSGQKNDFILFDGKGVPFSSISVDDKGRGIMFAGSTPKSFSDIEKDLSPLRGKVTEILTKYEQALFRPSTDASWKPLDKGRLSRDLGSIFPGSKEDAALRELGSVLGHPETPRGYIMQWGSSSSAREGFELNLKSSGKTQDGRDVLNEDRIIVFKDDSNKIVFYTLGNPREGTPMSGEYSDVRHPVNRADQKRK